jgi:chromosome transmission fidelity protein 1
MQLAPPVDIEELHRAAEGTCCAYYATRDALPDAEVVLAPYQVLLHRGTREAVGLPLVGNVVVIDEAHNLLEAIEAMHGATLPAAQLRLARECLDAYAAKYQARLSPANLSKIRELQACVARLADYVAAQRAGTHAPVGGQQL